MGVALLVALLCALLPLPATVRGAPAGSVSAVPDSKGHFCLAGRTIPELNRLFDGEPGGVVGADYQRAYPLPDGRVLWLFQDGAVRLSASTVVIVHNIAVLQDGGCFDVLYGGTRAAPRPFLFADATQQFRRWFWALDAEVGTDGLLYVFTAEMVERTETYLTRTEPVGVHVAAFDPAVNRIVWQGRPANSSPALYGWSITSDDQWTYIYAHCYRQFGYDEFVFGVKAFDRSCANRITVGRVPRGKVLDPPEYWDGAGWQRDPATAAPVVETAGRRVNTDQIEFTGGSFISVNKEGDWWGDTIFLSRSDHPTGPFAVYARLNAPTKCAECTSYFATWIPPEAVDAPGDRWTIALSHFRWDAVVDAAYRPTFHEVPRSVFLAAGRTIRVPLPDALDASAVTVNVTAVSPDRPGHLTVHPCDQPRPLASNLNFTTGQVIANLTLVRPDPHNQICIYTHATTDIVVDLTATHTSQDVTGDNNSSGGNNNAGLIPLDTPTRIADTRTGIGTRW